MERPAGDESKADVIGVGVLARVGQHSDALGAEEIYGAEVDDEQAAPWTVKFTVEGRAEPWCACVVDAAAGRHDDHAFVALVLRHVDVAGQPRWAPWCLVVRFVKQKIYLSSLSIQSRSRSVIGCFPPGLTGCVPTRRYLSSECVDGRTFLFYGDVDHVVFLWWCAATAIKDSSA